MQGSALVNAYLDGSVLIYIGGVEVGQGLFTKMIQIASRVLGIPVENIHIKETNTSITPNPTDTAASSTSDIFGMAVKVCHTYPEFNYILLNKFANILCKSLSVSVYMGLELLGSTLR